VQQNFFGVPIPSLLVSGFTQFNEEQLNATAARLGLAIEGQALITAKKLFSDTHHIPTVAELQLLDVLAPHLVRYGTDAAVTALDFKDSEEAHVWQDMLRVHNAKQTGATVPPTLAALLTLSSYALKKAGRHADTSKLFCDTSPALAAAFLGRSPHLSLDLGAVKVALAPEAPPRKRPQPGLFVLAVRTALPHLGTDVIARFFQRYEAYTPLPLMAVGKEGLGAHLPHLPVGLEIDLATAGLFDMAALSGCCQDTVLVAMIPRHATAVLADGAPATLIGHILHTPMLCVKSGPVSLVHLPLSLLCAWQHALCRATCHGQDAAPTADAVQITAAHDLVLGGVSYTGNQLSPLLSLLREMCRTGADMHGATLTATLRLPENGLSGAIAPLIAYHRFTAELALPTPNTQILCDLTLSAPTLTVGIAAPRHPLAKEPLIALDKALADGDFAALRHAIYANP